MQICLKTYSKYSAKLLPFSGIPLERGKRTGDLLPKRIKTRLEAAKF